MASPRRREAATLEGTLRHEPHRIEFRQVLRLLMEAQSGRSAATSGAEVAGGAIRNGEYRFGVVSSENFPVGQICDWRQSRTPEGPVPGARPRLMINFFGLIGPAGILPPHYGELAREASRHRNDALIDFLDMFNHRLIELMGEAYAKYDPVRQLDLGERKKRRDVAPYRETLRALVGIATPDLVERLKVEEEAVLYLAGHYCRSIGSGEALQDLLEEWFGFPIEVHQFEPHWLDIAPKERSRFDSNSEGRGCMLGQDTVIGDRVLDVQGQFSIRIGPLGYDDYWSFCPPGERFRKVCELIRLHVGCEFDFVIRPLLWKSEAPDPCLGKNVQLGYNCWMPSEEVGAVADDAVFRAPW